MFGSPVPVGKRPELNKASPSKWAMPHLVSMKEKKAETAPTSPTRRSSAPTASHDQTEQKPSPTSVDEKPHPEDRPLSPVHSTAGSATTTKRPEVAATSEDKTGDDDHGSISTVDSDISERPLLASKGQPKATGTREESSRAEEVIAPIPPATDSAGAPVPYYAMPKIMVHKPSRSSVTEATAPRTVDQVLASERQGESLTIITPMPFETPAAPAAPAWKLPDVPDATSAIPNATGNLPKVPVGIPGLPDAAKTLKQKKRVAFKHKTRNLAARNTVLKVLLGRQLAGPTKLALRSLAKGEPVVLESLDVVA